MWVIKTLQGFPGGSVVKNLPAKAGDQVQTPGREDPLEEEMAPHSSTLAWRIPWTDEPGGLQSMGPQNQTWLSNWAHIQTLINTSTNCLASAQVLLIKTYLNQVKSLLGMQQQVHLNNLV